MPLSKWERKERLYGKGTLIAAELGKGFSEADVSRVINDKADGTVNPEKARKIRVAVARKLRVSVAEAFPEHDSTLQGAA